MILKITASILLLSSFNSFGQDTWVQRDSVNGAAKSVGAIFTLNDDAYFLTGLDVFDFKRSMYKYDISQDDWDDSESLYGDVRNFVVHYFLSGKKTISHKQKKATFYCIHR